MYPNRCSMLLDASNQICRPVWQHRMLIVVIEGGEGVKRYRTNFRKILKKEFVCLFVSDQFICSVCIKYPNHGKSQRKRKRQR